MSNYENYSQTSKVYDQTRVPVGVEIVIGCLARSEVPLGQQYLLDAGCGTGSYSRALIQRVGRIAAVDMNAGMLAQARAKFSGSDGDRIEFHQSGIETLPFENATFDGLMINQVLHHLDDDATAGYPRIGGLLREFARVLKPGGALSVNTCSWQQVRQGFWYCNLIPDEVESMCQRHVPLDILQKLMVQSGFEPGGWFVPVDAVMQGTAYFDPLGPLDKDWRDGDSMWSTVSDEHLSEVQTKLKTLDREGRLESYVRENDRIREGIGQVTFVCAHRRKGSPAL